METFLLVIKHEVVFSNKHTLSGLQKQNKSKYLINIILLNSVGNIPGSCCFINFSVY